MQRIQKRRAGKRQTQNALIGLLSAVSMTRIGLTQLLPLCGSAAWWLSAACMLPGLFVYGALRLLLRHTHTRTLTDCARKLLGNFGIILIMLTLTLPLLLDGIASLTALITFFTEGIGARGSQFTLIGVYGIVLFMTALCVRLCSLTSLGAPFAAPLSPPRAHNPDLLTRHPLWQQRWRTWLGSAENNMRSRGRMRGWDRRGQ